jgi:AraC-like DNA-binding protein
MAPRRLARVIEYIKNNVDSPLMVSEVSQLAGLSESQFSKLFKRSTGLTPHQFILNERINCSKEFLSKGMSIVHVALDVGFAHQAHFTTVFKNLVGVTPRQYQLSSFNDAAGTDPPDRTLLLRTEVSRYGGFDSQSLRAGNRSIVGENCGAEGGT